MRIRILAGVIALSCFGFPSVATDLTYDSVEETRQCALRALSRLDFAGGEIDDELARKIAMALLDNSKIDVPWHRL